MWQKKIANPRNKWHLVAAFTHWIIYTVHGVKSTVVKKTHNLSPEKDCKDCKCILKWNLPSRCLKLFEADEKLEVTRLNIEFGSHKFSESFWKVERSFGPKSENIKKTFRGKIDRFYRFYFYFIKHCPTHPHLLIFTFSSTNMMMFKMARKRRVFFLI